MRVLIDTHFIIWLATDQASLSARERRFLDDDQHELICSAISIWELRVKENAVFRRGGRRPLLSASDAISFAAIGGIPILAPTVDDYAASLIPPLDHSDPFDEMLLVHAQQLGARLLTRDARLVGHALAASPV